jgi:hypothetical protein
LSALLDARGCLTEAGLRALDAAPPGQGPAEAAAHLAGCAHCQRRFLARGGDDVAGISAVPGKAVAPPLWRTAVIVLLLVVMVMIAVVGIRWLAAS